MRIFIGVELDDAVRAAAAEAAEQLRERLKRSRAHLTARWVDPENLHVTLWFLGEVEDGHAVELTATLQSPFATAAFPLTIKGCGAFPPSGPPRIFWLGVASGADSMVALHDELKRRLAPLGFEPERRPYSPHVTIARVKEIRRDDARRTRETLAALPADCGTCEIRAITLFRSRLSPKGSHYEPLLRVPLS